MMRAFFFLLVVVVPAQVWSQTPGAGATVREPDANAIAVLERLFPTTVGDPLANLGGEALVEPIQIPLWIQLESRGNCDVLTNLLIVPLGEDRVYLDQQNINCYVGSGPTCRILHVPTRTLHEPGHCITSTTGGRYDFEVLGDGWYVVFSYMEGTGVVSLVEWSLKSPMRVHLDQISEFEHPVSVHRDGFLIRSMCAPLHGGCTYEMMIERTSPVLEWFWKPGGTPTLLSNPTR